MTEAIKELERYFTALACAVPHPILVRNNGSFVWRYGEQGPRQAVVQKLARIVSSLNAISLLLENGFVQEAASLTRVLADLREDVMFLSKAMVCPEHGEHELLGKLLDNFYDEVIEDRSDVVGSLLKRRQPVSRKDLRQATERLDRKLFANTDHKPMTDLSRAVGTLFNSFVHGGSPQIMEMYGGDPPHFHLHGMLGTPHMAVHEVMFREQIVTTAFGFSFAARALGRPDIAGCASALANRLMNPTDD